MTDPQYVNTLSDIYTSMYNHPGEEKPLVVQEGVSDVEKVPRWKQVLRDAAKNESRKRPPHAPHLEPREDASEEEESSTAEQRAQQYLETIIGTVPTAVGGINIHRIIKDAFIAGIEAS